MNRTSKIVLSMLFAGSTLMIAQAAFAQAAPPAAGGGGGGGAGVTTSDTKEGYGYNFTDDPLSAGGFGPNDATIRVRPGPVRTTLIRPRTSFVPEMLKSVENL